MRTVILLQGYNYSGVSFLRDFFREFNDTFVFLDEFDLMRHSGGVLDLYNTLSMNNPFLDDSVIRRFKQLVEYLYRKRRWGDILGKAFLERSYELYNDLLLTKIEFSIRAYSTHEEIRPLFPQDRFGIHRHRDKQIRRSLNAHNHDIYLVKSYSNENLLDLLKNYTHDILNLFPASKFLVLVHPLQISSELSWQLKFFNNSKVITISRDPRDVYVDFSLVRDPDVFVAFMEKWYAQYQKEDISSQQLLKIKFEDFIFEYDCTAKKIIDFCGLGNVVEPSKRRKFSDPDKSKLNVGIYKNYPDVDAIKFIEKKLETICYREI